VPRPIRVVVDARIDARDGIGRYTRCLVGALRRLDPPEIDLRVLGPTGTQRYSVAEERELLGFVRGSAPHVVHLCNYRIPQERLGATLVVTVHDSAHLTAPEICFTDRDFARWFGADGLVELADQVVALERDGPMSSPPGASQHARYVRAMLYHALRRAAVVVVPTRALAAELSVVEPGAPLSVAPWGVDHLPRPAGWGSDRGRGLALFVGVARDYKGIAELGAAFARTRAIRAGVRLALAGERCEPGGPAAAALLRAGVGTPVLLGAVGDRTLAVLYGRARVLVHPSRFESFGFPPLEALRFGCPVVANDLPALREVLGPHARLVDVADARRFAEAIDAAVSAGRRDPRVPRGVRHARRFTWHAHARRMVALYRGAAERL
jgi:glycosyltransferase involved in cell wall biosynthesis